jgi:hypothetical protein
MKPIDALKKLYLWSQRYVREYSSVHEENLQVVLDKAYYIIKEALSDQTEYFNENEIMAKLESDEFETLGNETNHIKNHLQNVHNKESTILEKHIKKETKGKWIIEDNVVRFIENDNLCARYEWTEDDEMVVFYDLCDTEEK